MKLFSSSRQPDPALYVYSSTNGYFYFCPTTEAVDAHLVELYGSMVGASGLTDYARERVWCDIDRLLLRRSYLRCVGEAPTRRELSDLAAHDRRLVA
jgi:hypothetical protein